ncbi:MAG: universal stress protein [Myxococcota bacterium]
MKPLVVVCTDFSECSEEALVQAADVAKRDGARLLLLHVSSPPGRRESQARAWDEEAMHTLRSQRRRHFADLSDNDVQYEAIPSNDVAQGICDAAHRNRASLIMVGSHGRTGVVRQLLGSVAENVVRHAQCSVLVVRKSAW